MDAIVNVKIKTPVFEGPLEMLLNLIEKRKLFISDISLAQVADDYIEKVKSLESFPMREGAHFILIASTLLLIKSKSLLPVLDLSSEEENDIEELEKRLKLYKVIRDTLPDLRNIFFKTPLFFLEERSVQPVFSPDKTINKKELFLAINRVILALPKNEKKMPKVLVKKVISLEEVIANLAERVTSGLKMSFKKYSGFGKSEKVNVIVSFLAMLELVKRGAITVIQNKQFDDITIETDSINTPRY